MTTGLHGTTDVATMTLAFPTQPMTHEGPQTLKTLLAIQQHLINCAQSFAVDGQPFGLLNLAVPVQLYALYTAAPYPQRTPDPGPRPIYAAAGGPVAQRNTENIFAIAYRAHHNEKHMDQALINQMYLCGAQTKPKIFVMPSSPSSTQPSSKPANEPSIFGATPHHHLEMQMWPH